MYKKIEEFYNDECEEERLHSGLGKIEYITTMKYLRNLCPKNCYILDACAGTGVYSFELARLGHSVIAGDLVGAYVEQIKKQNKTENLLKKVYQGSILDLSQFETESFDIVLNLGSYYHLLNSNDRKESIQECLRVLKKDGLYFMAYINRFANYILNASEMNKDFGMFERFMESGTADNIFYCSTPEMVENDVQDLGLTILHNIGTDGCIYDRGLINSMTNDTFERFMKIHLAHCEDKSILGCSQHSLIICRK